VSRIDFTSKSKIPPQIGDALGEIRQHRGNLVELFGFHDEAFLWSKR
jgi:hypothetical protein